jgi:hypothetical protein
MRGKGFKPYSIVKSLVYGCNSGQCMGIFIYHYRKISPGHRILYWRSFTTSLLVLYSVHSFMTEGDLLAAA